MKSILLIVASLFAFNENVNTYNNFENTFEFITSSYTPTIVNQEVVSGRYNFEYQYNSTSMFNNEYFDLFKNGSSELFIKIPTEFDIDLTRTNLFSITADDYTFYIEPVKGLHYENWYSVYNFYVNLEFEVPMNIYISIPTYHQQPMTDYATTFSSLSYYTRTAFIYEVAYNNGYSEGYADGHVEGFYDGISEGYTDGYTDGNADGYLEGYYDGYRPNAFNEGYDEGYAEGYDNGVYVGSLGELPDLFTILGSAFTSIASILSITLFPGFTLGLLLFLPLIFGIAYVLLKLLLGNG